MQRFQSGRIRTFDFISFFRGGALVCEAEGGKIRGTNVQWILEKKFPGALTLHFTALGLIGRKTGPFSAEAPAMPERWDTVIGNLREGVERLAPGRACISVVSDHGFVKTGAPSHLFLAFRKARLSSSGSFEVAAGSLARCVRFFVEEVLHAVVRNPQFHLAVHDHLPGY